MLLFSILLIDLDLYQVFINKFANLIEVRYNYKILYLASPPNIVMMEVAKL